MKKQAEEWLKYAYMDLLTIKQIIEKEELTAAVSFHAQQCVEKSLKALLVLHDQKVPRIHDLRKLYAIVTNFGRVLIFSTEIIDQLNQVYIDTRYPGDFGLLPSGLPSHNKAEEFMREAEAIYAQVAKMILTEKN